MKWSLKSLWTGSERVPPIELDPEVLQEHIAILRRLRAPQDILDLAQKVADANSAPALKTETR